MVATCRRLEPFDNPPALCYTNDDAAANPGATEYPDFCDPRSGRLGDGAPRSTVRFSSRGVRYSAEPGNGGRCLPEDEQRDYLASCNEAANHC